MQLDFELKASSNKKYKIDSIWDSVFYTKKSTIG